MPPRRRGKPGSNEAPEGVSPDQRFTAANPCPICDGHKDMPLHVGIRCYGYMARDGRGAICTRVESGRAAGDTNGWWHPIDEARATQTPKTPIARSAEIEDVYIYRDEGGAPRFEVVRYLGKQFRQRTPDGQWGIGGVELVPYKLPELIRAVANRETIYVVEGEKDVHSVERAGGVATCNPGGAGSWKDEFSRYLEGADVIVVADNDGGTGLTHAHAVRRSLLPVARSVVIVQAAEGKDATDHLAAGHELSKLSPLPSRFTQVALGSYEAQPSRWLYEPILLADTYTLITAAAGAGKTFLALSLVGLLVADGMHVAYLDQENGPDVMKTRADALCIPGEHLNEYVHYFPYPHPGQNELDELVHELVALGAVLIVFDAKANFLAAADLDEDSSMDNTAWHSRVIQPLLGAGSAVVELDHSGHRAGGRPRGSSAKEAVAEASWTMTSDKQFDQRTTATVTLKRGLKNRRGALPAEVRLTMGGGAHGFVFRQASDAQQVDDARTARRRRMRAQISRVVERHWDDNGEPLSLNAISKVVTGARSEISEVARELAQTPGSGISMTTGPRSAVLLAPTQPKE